MKTKIKIGKSEIRKFLTMGRLMLAKYEDAIETGRDPDYAFEDVELNVEIVRGKSK